MRIGILTTRTERYHPNRRLAETARRMGHEPFLVHPLRCTVRVGGTAASMLYSGKPLPTLDLLLPRIGATIDEYELAVARHIEAMGVPMVNGYGALLLSRDKFLTLQTLHARGIRVPKSVLVPSGEGLPSDVRNGMGFPAVLKVCRGRQGKGVMLVESVQALEFILENWGNGPNLMVQEFVAESRGRDIRIVVAGGRAIGSMMRISRGGEFRANVHLKGKGHPFEPSQEMVRMAVESAKILGLAVAGVDMLLSKEGPCVIEVNSTPGFRELERVCRKDVAHEILSYALLLATKGAVP